MYDDEAKYQRPIISQDKDKDIVVDDQNWIQYLGNSRYVTNRLFNLFSEIEVDFRVTAPTVLS